MMYVHEKRGDGQFQNSDVYHAEIEHLRTNRELCGWADKFIAQVGF